MATKRKRIFTITENEYLQGRDDCDGICLSCGEIQYGGCEPDARNYECDSWGEMKVFGMEEALLMGRLDFAEEEEERVY